MNFIFQRIIKNDFQWLRPSPGRRGKFGEGDFVKKNGFGHEDWNFNGDLIIDDHIYGYTYFQPSEAKKRDNYNIVFAVRSLMSWQLVGIYRDSQFVETSPMNKYVLERKTQDLLQLGQSLGKEFQTYPAARREMRKSVQWLHWKVHPANVIRSAVPIPIPKRIFDTSNFRLVKPTNLTEKEFTSISALMAEQYEASVVSEADVEFPEGRMVETLHKIRERNPTIVRLAKDNYRKVNKNLDCQVCGFSFAKAYGPIGIDFIEAHHTRPLSDMGTGSRTKVEDIALVCSNCHRMLHRKRPWLATGQLKQLLK